MLKIKPLRQTPGHCGPYSLKMVLDFYGIKKNIKELISLCKANSCQGTKVENILAVVKKFGLSAEIIDNAELKDIKKFTDEKIPLIVDWFSEDDGHYSVAVGMDKKFIYLQDPEIAGIKKIDLKTFKRIWFDFSGDYLKSEKDLILRRMIVIKK